MIAALAFVRRIPGMLSPKGWLAVAVLAAFLLFGAYCAHRAAEGERDHQAAEQAKIEVKAASARETAADERLNDTLTIQDRQKERDDAAEALPDSVPDARELQRRCRQLRDNGIEPAACG
ncbi:hypothetical protein [Brevundimonas sp.]|uniref:hypothetical protein n=1 Tax=Brevundimonas sp. TaxID=1871086 RepID=UPI0035AEEF6E